MEISKTKQNFIDVARLLFAKKGFENTTMNDIAEEANKGRRTLYLYFKNKNDILHSVIEQEIQQLYVKLHQVVIQNIKADEKLILFLFTRLDAIRDVVKRNGHLRADFFRNIWLVENVRKEFDQNEISFLYQILREGVEDSIFSIADLSCTAQIIHYSMKGLEVPFIRGTLRLNYNNEKDVDIIRRIIFKGIKIN